MATERLTKAEAEVLEAVRALDAKMVREHWLPDRLRAAAIAYRADKEPPGWICEVGSSSGITTPGGTHMSSARTLSILLAAKAALEEIANDRTGSAGSCARRAREALEVFRV